MRSKAKLLIVILGLAAAMAVAIQTGAISVLVEMVQGVFAGKPAGPVPELSTPEVVGNPTEEDLGGFAETDVQPQPPTGSGPANILEEPPGEDSSDKKGSSPPSK